VSDADEDAKSPDTDKRNGYDYVRGIPTSGFWLTPAFHKMLQILLWNGFYKAAKALITLFLQTQPHFLHSFRSIYLL
jgi:hypothetical protein